MNPQIGALTTPQTTPQTTSADATGVGPLGVRRVSQAPPNTPRSPQSTESPTESPPLWNRSVEMEPAPYNAAGSGDEKTSEEPEGEREVQEGERREVELTAGPRRRRARLSNQSGTQQNTNQPIRTRIPGDMFVTPPRHPSREEQLTPIIKKHTEKLYEDVKKTANRQGASAYARSFGFFGVASRLASQFAEKKFSPLSTMIFKAVAPLTMPAVHTIAGKYAAPGRDSSQFIKQNRQGGVLPPNTAGNAFHPFGDGLALGNPAVVSAVEVPLALKAALEDGLKPVTSPAGEVSSKEREVANTIKNIALSIPGFVSGMHTARNIYHAKADAGFSIQEPIKDDNGKPIGVLVTHQNPDNAPSLFVDGRACTELGYVEIDTDSKRYKALIIKDQLNDVVRLHMAPDASPTDITPKAGGVSDFAKARLQDAKTIFTPQTAIKVTSLASTLALNVVIGPIVKSAAKTELEKHVPPSVAEPLATIVATIVTSYNLRGFISKFKAFGTAVPQPGDSKSMTFAKNVGRWTVSALPILGGKVTEYFNPSSRKEPADLSRSDFETLATRQAEMLFDLKETLNSEALLTSSTDPIIKLSNDEYSINAKNLIAYLIPGTGNSANDSNV